MGISENGDSTTMGEKLGLGLQTTAPPPIDAAVEKLGLGLQTTAPSPIDAATESLNVEFRGLELADDSNHAAIESLNGEIQGLGLEEDSNHAAIDSLNVEIQGLGLEEGTNYLDSESASKEEEEEEEEEEKDSDLKEEKKDGSFHFPVRPYQPDCPFYLRTGLCRYGSNCKFNHPPRGKHQVGMEGKKNEKENEEEEGKEKEKDEEENEEEKGEGKEHENEEFPEREGQPECKYYLKTGGCKFGKACRYNHPREKAGVGEPVDLNFLGLPMRPGEKECPFYMRTGSCKFATNCRFHHPDPTAVGECDPLPVYRNDSSLTLHASTTSPPLPTAWSRTSNERVPYMEASPQPYLPVMLPPPHSVHPSLEWNGFLAPGSTLFSLERNLKPPSVSPMKVDSSTRQNRTMVEEFPERPGQPECQFYMKTGNCKFKWACRYHHPKARVPKSPSACVLSSMGLPLRPDQIVCSHYSRFGICKFGPACKYDHPINYAPAPPATSASN